MLLTTTLLGAASLAFLQLMLTAKVVLTRRELNVLYGDGGVDAMTRAVRAHGNLTESAPIFLILLGLIELSGMAPSWSLALALGAFVVGRLIHIQAMFTASVPIRVLGMSFTLIPIGGLALGGMALLLMA